MHRNLGIGSWIARRARMTPDKVALVYGERSWTYRELDQRITRLARGLARRGIGEGDRVAFFGHNHPAALETLFACGLTGAVAVPVHPGFDEATLVQVLGDAAPKAVVATPDMVAALQRAAREVTIEHRFTTGLVGEGVERYEDLIETGSDEPMDRPIGLDDTCLLAFSSGTTGRNKGVVLTHGNMFFNAVNVLTCLDYRSDDVILTSAPLYRMGGLGFSLALLFKGGTCVLQERADADESLRLIARHRTTVLFDAVGALEAMADAAAFESTDLSSLRVCMTGGTRVPPRLVEAFAERGLCLQPGYGLSEAAPLALVMPEEEVRSHPGAAGRPPMLCDVRVVDPDLEDVADGELGELLVHGPNVMRGYWHEPEATRRALVEGGWLRTGDAGFADADGTITVIGRIVDTLVLGGRRIHPAPFEAELAERDDVVEAAMVQRSPEAPPVLFVVPSDQRPIGERQLVGLWRRHFGAEPAELHLVRSLPRNPNGKLLRTRLRAMP